MTARTRKTRESAKPRVGKYIFLGFFITCIAMMVALVLATITLMRGWLEDLPDYTDSDAYLYAEPTKFLDADGNIIAELYLENRTPVSIDEVSDYILEATVDIEDERYYEHGGVDLQGILRAVVVQFTGGSEGASTITQQVVRNTVLKNEQFERTISRKVREAYIAMELEKMYSKDDILMMYLNTIFYGQGAYGIEAAAETFFGKSAADVTLVEAATLAGLPQSPTSYNPMVNPDLALERRNLVLGNMLRNEDITQEQYDEAIATPLTLNYTPREESGAWDHQYFVDYVRTELQKTFSSDIIFKGGLTVYTTIDRETQEAAENAVNNVVGGSGDDLDAAVVAIDPDNGYIRAMVGGWSYDAHEYNLATAKRQPGSSFKTFTLTAAIQAGIDPNTLINSNSGVVVGDWTVNNINYGNWGTIPIWQATEWSSNSAYAQIIHAIGPQAVIDTAHAMGIDSELYNGDVLTLGVSECSPLEMAEAYATLASGGVHHDAVAILRVEDRDGNPIYEADTTGEQAISPEVAAATTDVLEGVVNNTADSSRTGATAALSVDQPVAGKTGTTDNRTDLWFCGYTPQLSTAVWVGYPSGSQTIYYNGGEAAYLPNPIFKQFMDAALEGQPREEFPTAGTPTYRYDWDFSQGTGYSQADLIAAQQAEAEAAAQAQAETEAQAAQDAGTTTTTDGTTTTDPGTGGGTTGGETTDPGTGGGETTPPVEDGGETTTPPAEGDDTTDPSTGGGGEGGGEATTPPAEGDPGTTQTTPEA